MIKLGNKVMVSDPCYGMNTWCQGVIENVLPGEYECEVEYSDEGMWGKRVQEIQVTHIDHKWEAVTELCPFEVGVDSGQAGIFDYGYYERFHDEDGVNDDWYDQVCDITSSEDSAGDVGEFGFVSSSGFGDGGYNCYVGREKNGYIVTIRIVFIESEDEEYEY